MWAVGQCEGTGSLANKHVSSATGEERKKHRKLGISVKVAMRFPHRKQVLW